MRCAWLAAMALVSACKSGAPSKEGGGAPSAAPSTLNSLGPSVVNSIAPSAIASVDVATRFQIDAQQRTSAFLAVMRDLYAGSSNAEALTPFFPPGEGGEARARALARSIVEGSSKGDRVERYVVHGAKVDAPTMRATVDVLEWIKNGAENRCRTFAVVWRSVDGVLVRDGDLVDDKPATCPKA